MLNELMNYSFLKEHYRKNQPEMVHWLLVHWFLNLFFPGAGKPEKAGRDNPSAHGRV